MDIVFFIYGLAFMVLGVVIVIWPKEGSRFEFARLSLWLTGFAFVHGTLEWMELWRVVRNDNPALAAARPLTLLASYVLLFEFGRRMLHAAQADTPHRQRSGAWIHALLLGGVAAGSFAHDASLDSLAICTRYLYGFPAALLSAVGLQAYAGQRIRPELTPREFTTVRRSCQLAGAAFAAYGVLGGLIVPQAPWPPASWLNQEGFVATVGIPVQILRAACAVLIAASMAHVLRIFHLEQQQHLTRTLQQTADALEEAGRLGRHNRLLLESVAEGIFGLDTAGRTTFINPVALTLLGYTADELIGQPMHALTHHSQPDGQPYPAEACPSHQTLQDGQPRHVAQDHFFRKDGSSFPVSYHTAQVQEQGRVIGAVVVFEDISERVRLDTELRAYRDHLEQLVTERTAQLTEAEAYSRLILESSASGLYGMDAQGRFTFINQVASDLLGHPHGSLIGQKVHLSVHHHHADGTEFPPEDCPMLAALVQGESVHNDDDLFWRADGSPLPVATATRPMHRDGQIVGAVVSFTDIRQRKAADEARRQALREAERLVRIKSEFLANMSHEIRTPLNAIIGMTHLIRRAGVPDSQAGRLQRIEVAGQHLLEIINTILDLSKIEAGKFVLADGPVKLEAIAANVCSILAERARARQVELVTHLAPLPPHLQGDATRLQQALLNLTGNAVKFTENGRVCIRIRVDDESPESVRIHFEVEDTGIGIPADQLPRLFTAFQQVDGSATRQHGGTGLGLAITRNLAELMGGQAGASSTPGVGSRFWFTARLRKGLPDADPHHAHGHSPIEAALRAQHAQRRLLLVEDEPINREVALDVLAECFHEVDVACDGAEAVELAACKAYDIILMDIQMPHLDGLAATRQIRAQPGRPAPTIIAMTANAFAEDRARCQAAGMDDFIAKPFTAELLYATLLHWLSRRDKAGDTTTA
ncbi:MAG: ATP-binding protein [Zoogloea sp.]|uniref:ATP-binding protein n=1 Tax=Zoogloea sp. TaxID=49181 RepID=UPI00260B47D9|nr:ATP-binding protein [Zoogloea sp.]MDD3329192.1 ATP-binding protein [Zoogloea sp.]